MKKNANPLLNARALSLSLSVVRAKLNEASNLQTFTLKNTIMKTITAVRTAFWEAFPQFKSEYRKRKRQNEYSTDIRCTFVDFVDSLHRDGQITDNLAQRVTL